MTTKKKRRAIDPQQTSLDAHLAATTPSAKLRASQARVLNMFKLYGDMHDAQLLAVLHDAEKSAGMKPMSPSGARSRRSELAKPNDERIEQIAREFAAPLALGELEASKLCEVMLQARQRLRVEGFRSPLWDTGKREIVDGRTVIVWGIAR